MEGQAEKQPTAPQTLSDLASMVEDYDAGEAVDVGEQSTEEEQGEELAEEVGAEEVAEEESEEVESDDEEAVSEDETVTITHDGKEVSLKKSEALELAQKGFDYTKKTQALADERKALEPVKQQYQERLAQHEQALNETLHRLQTAADFLESELGQPPSTDLASYDAGAYIAQKEAYENRVAKLRNTYGQIQHLDQQKNQLRQSELLEKANETEKYLVEKLPGWKDDPEKSLAELNSYIKEYGLSPETTKEAYVEKGLWELAHKAREYDRLVAKKAELKPAKASVPKVLKPSSNPVPANVRQTEALKRYKQKPTLDSLAGLIDYL
jgi:hypothetical protein